MWMAIVESPEMKPKLHKKQGGSEWHPVKLPDTQGFIGDDPCKYVFPVSANAVRLAWERTKKGVNIANIRFHNLKT